MRTPSSIALLLATAAVAGCGLILGFDKEHVLACPPDETSPCLRCKAPADCGTPEPCHLWACEQGSCVATIAPAETPCEGGFCSGDDPPTCVACVADGDCEDGAYCFENECAACDNNKKDGDESEPDCGGEHCPGCPGQACSENDQCKSNHCADNVCCDTACADVCSRCEPDGVCGLTPQFADDPPGCAGAMTCNGGGVCALKLGEPCSSHPDCASQQCSNGKCAGP